MSNVNYNKYLNMLMKRSYSDSEDATIQNAGSVDASTPFGGFPPIFVCSNDSKTDNDENKNREYSTHKTSVSIKDIMQRRRNATPFIST